MAEETQQKVVNSPAELWQKISRSKKVSIILVFAGLVICLSLLIKYFTTPSMGILFRNMNPEDAAGVIERLEETGVAYKLEAGGRNILVPESRMDELRISLSSDGSLYSGGVGFELFDQTKLGTTESERRVNIQRALQGELQRTISQLEGISQSRVHLVMPEPSVFLRETTLPSASIVLKLNPLSQLTKDQVMGIVYLVAGSVENLKPENVTVIDSKGRILSASTGENGSWENTDTAVTMRQLEIKRAFEEELETRIQAMLEKVLGAGTVAAMVTAELDFGSEEVTEITYGEPVLRSSSRTQEEFEGSGLISAGQTGTDSNIPGYPYVSGEEGESSYSRLDEIDNYEIAETVSQSIKAPGEVLNLSASVIYDNSRGTLTPRQMEDLEGLVMSALGLSFEQGDSVKVAAINFDTTYLEETFLAMEQAARQENIRIYIRYGLIVLAFLAVLIFLLFFLKRLKKYLAEAEESRRVAQELAATAIKQEQPQEIDQEEKQQKRVKEIAQKYPDAVVSLLKTWLLEDQR